MSDPDSPKSDVNSLLPTKSGTTYQIVYQRFIDWCKEKNQNDYSESTLLVYFSELATVMKMKGSTLWCHYSMIKSLLNINHGVDISKYLKLRAFLKKQNEGYAPKKPRIFTKEHLETFISEAPDTKYLGIKIALIVGISGSCRCEEMIKIKIDDIEDLGSLLYIKIPGSKTNKRRSFTIVGENFINIYRKYVSLRPEGIKEQRFFLKYKNGKCHRLVMGINKIGSVPREVACFLKLPNWKEYTGHSFRQTPSTLLVDEATNTTNKNIIKKELIKANIRSNTRNINFEDQEQTSSSIFKSIHEEVDIKAEPDDNINTEESDEEYIEDLEEECAEAEELEGVVEPVQVDEKQTTPKKRKRRIINFHRKPLFVKNFKSAIKEDEFEIYAKHIATQLKQLPLDISITCQNQIQEVIAKARLKVLNNEQEIVEPKDVFSSLGSYVGKRLRSMESKQQIIAEHLILKVITKGNVNKLSENTDIVDKNKDSDEVTQHNHLSVLKTSVANTCDNTSSNNQTPQSTTLICNTNCHANNSNIDALSVQESLKNKNNIIESPTTSCNKKRKKIETEPSNFSESEQLLNLTTSEDIDRQEELNLKELARLSPVFISLDPLSQDPQHQSNTISNIQLLDKGFANINHDCKTEKPTKVQEEKT